MKIIFIKDRGLNLKSIFQLFNSNYFNKLDIELKILWLNDFIIDKVKILVDDIILYQTFPDDRVFENGDIRKPIKSINLKKLNGKLHRKFNFQLIQQTDLKFLTLKNKYKLLIDVYDDPNLDAFSRFIDKNYPFTNLDLIKLFKKLNKKNYFQNIKRIKNYPSYDYKKKFNIFYETTFFIHKDIINFNEINNKRNKIIHCYLGDNNKIRTQLKKKLMNNKNKDNIDFRSYSNYREDLKNILCEVNAPGWGDACYRHLYTLNAGCLLFTHESFNTFDILPNVKLIENEDYISFNIENIDDKIEFILNNEEIIDKIRINGHKKFMKYYDYNEIYSKKFIRNLQKKLNIQ